MSDTHRFAAVGRRVLVALVLSGFFSASAPAFAEDEPGPTIEADENLMQALATEPRLMPHLHLSLQHGDDLILKRMKRRHLRDDAIRFCEEARRLRPEMTFGADIIAGFPTETDAHFENSLKLVDDCGLTWLHVFPYSPRQGTPAARMPQVAGPLIRERARLLRAAGDQAVQAHKAFS